MNRHHTDEHVVLKTLTGDALKARLDDLTGLRITVFREWPYLYEGDLDYERRYLSKFASSNGAVIIGAFDGETLVGAATAAPLTDHFDDFAAPFLKAGLTPERYFYFGESVLLRPYRGQGIGVRFFEEREEAARRSGFDRSYSAVSFVRMIIRCARRIMCRLTGSGAIVATSRWTA